MVPGQYGWPIPTDSSSLLRLTKAVWQPRTTFVFSVPCRRDEIRILRLCESDEAGEALRADLLRRRLQNLDWPYKALSYCLGSQLASLGSSGYCNGIITCRFQRGITVRRRS